jgi:hypothetical protein
VAKLLGAPSVRAIRRTREQAVAALRVAIDKRVAKGTLGVVDVQPIGVSDLFGRFKDDPTLREICEEAYRLRDADMPK